MVWYSFQEQAEMVFVYDQAGGNGREAARMYRATCSGRQHHLHHIIIRSHLSAFVWTWVSWRPIRTAFVPWMNSVPLFDVVLQWHLPWKLHFRTQSDMNLCAPFPISNHLLKFVGGLKTRPVYWSLSSLLSLLDLFNTLLSQKHLLES